MTQVLARKWRPRAFEELVGQDHVVRALTNALTRERLHHAYLFTGTRGVGKTTIARIIAKALNCATGVTATPCGKCSACTEIDAGRFVDLLEIDAASNTQVDAMRELLENALYAPTSARFKVYLIDEVHMLSRNAFNAMLKTLEEPPPHIKFILATTDPQKIPVTVLSRCLQFNLKQIPPALVQRQLDRVLQAEAIASEPAALALIARAAQGSMRDALSLLDQAIAHGDGRVEEASVRDMLGAVDRSYLYRLLEALVAGDGAAMIGCADEMAARSLSFESALQDLATLLHRIALAQTIPGSLDPDDPERARTEALATVMSAEDVQLHYQIALQGRQDMSLAPDEYAGFTMTLMRLLAFAPGDAGASPPASVRRPPRQTAGPGPAAPAAANDPAGARGPAAHAASGASATAATSADWPAIVAALRLTGAARQLAQHCELKAFADDRIELHVPSRHGYLLDQSALKDRLKAALDAHLGRDVRLSFTTGDPTGNSPAEIEDRERQSRIARAETAIRQDPFVRELEEQFGARVVDDSIKPIQ